MQKLARIGILKCHSHRMLDWSEIWLRVLIWSYKGAIKISSNLDK